MNKFRLLLVTLMLFVLGTACVPLEVTVSDAPAAAAAEAVADTDDSEAAATEAQPQPQLATAMAHVELSNQFGRSLVGARGNHFLISSAPPLGHVAEEMNPVEAMFAALATCGIFVYEAAAQELDIPLHSAAATVQGDFAGRGLVVGDVDPYVQEFRVHMDLDGPDADQAAMLAEQFTQRCPIYTTLERAAPIVITTNGEEMGGPVAEGLATGTVQASLSNQPGRAIVNVRENYSIVDSVPPLGGPNEAVNPLDLLLAAQGTCGTLIMEKAALDQEIPLAGVAGTIEVDFNPAGVKDGSVSPHIQAMRINWQVAGVDEAQAETLVGEWLRRCPIYNTLKRATDVMVMVDGEEMAIAGQ